MRKSKSIRKYTRYGGNNSKKTLKRKLNHIVINIPNNNTSTVPNKKIRFANNFGKSLTHVREYEPNGRLHKFRTASTTRRKINNIEKVLKNTNQKRRFKAAMGEIYGNIHASSNKPVNMAEIIYGSKVIPNTMKAMMLNKIVNAYGENINFEK